MSTKGETVLQKALRSLLSNCVLCGMRRTETHLVVVGPALIEVTAGI